MIVKLGITDSSSQACWIFVFRGLRFKFNQAESLLKTVYRGAVLIFFGQLPIQTPPNAFRGVVLALLRSPASG